MAVDKGFFGVKFGVVFVWIERITGSYNGKKLGCRGLGRKMSFSIFRSRSHLMLVI